MDRHDSNLHIRINIDDTNYVLLYYTEIFFFLHRAENETKAKLEKVAEIKKVNAAMMAIKSEISKYEDTLKEYQMYRKFLDNLTPQVCISFFDNSGKVLNYEYFAYEF